MTVHEESASAGPDAFEIFDRGHGAGTIRDPYPRWAELRREAAVHEGDVDAVVEAGGASIYGDRPVFSVLGYDAVAEVLLDGERFSTEVFNEIIGPVLGRVILGMGGDEHRAHRGIVQQAFSRRAMAAWERDVVAPVVNDHLDRIQDLGRANLVRDLTFHFPVYVIAEMLGLPKEDLADFHRWSVEMLCLRVRSRDGVRRLGEAGAVLRSTRGGSTPRSSSRSHQHARLRRSRWPHPHR